MLEYMGYEIVKADGNNVRMKRIKTIGKGSIPTVLTGLFTSEKEAMKAIDNYKQFTADRIKENAKKQSNG